MYPRPLTSIRPKFVNRPQSPSTTQTIVKEPSQPSLDDLIRTVKRGQSLGTAPQEQTTETVSHAKHKEKTANAPALGMDAVKRILDGSPNKLAPSGRPMPANVDGDGSSCTGYRVMQPIYDHRTKNKSFLKVHEQLKLLGVRNNEFFLL